MLAQLCRPSMAGYRSHGGVQQHQGLLAIVEDIKYGVPVMRHQGGDPGDAQDQGDVRAQGAEQAPHGGEGHWTAEPHGAQTA